MSKSYERKKKWRRACRVKVVKEGMVNAANGSWVRADTGKDTDRSLQVGYHMR